MSPKPSALEEDAVERMATENLEEKFESSANVFEIGTTDGGSDKSGEAVGEDVFSTPAPGKRKLVSAKAANDKATASSSSSVDRPLEQEATERPTMPQRTFEEQQERLQVFKEQRELQELRGLKVKLDENEAETKRLRENAEQDKKKLRADFEQEKKVLETEMRKAIREALEEEREKNKRVKEEEEAAWYEDWGDDYWTPQDHDAKAEEYSEAEEEEELQAFVAATHEAESSKKGERSSGSGDKAEAARERESCYQRKRESIYKR